MSNRFGRNQKRKLKAEMTSIKAEVVELRRSCDNSGDEVFYMRGVFEELRQKLGRYFSGLPAQELMILKDEVDPNFFHMVMERYNPWIFERAAYEMRDGVGTILDLHVASAEVFKDDMGRQHHVYLKTPAGRVGYAFTPQVIEDMPAEQLARHVSFILAGKLKTLYPKGVYR